MQRSADIRLAGDLRPRRLQPIRQLLGMHQNAALFRQRRFFTRLRVDLFKLGDGVA